MISKYDQNASSLRSCLGFAQPSDACQASSRSMQKLKKGGQQIKIFWKFYMHFKPYWSYNLSTYYLAITGLSF